MRFNGFDIMKDSNEQFYITLQTVKGSFRIDEDETYSSIISARNEIKRIVDKMKLRFTDNMSEGEKRNILLEYKGLKELDNLD